MQQPLPFCRKNPGFSQWTNGGNLFERNMQHTKKNKNRSSPFCFGNCFIPPKLLYSSLPNTTEINIQSSKPKFLKGEHQPKTPRIQPENPPDTGTSFTRLSADPLKRVDSNQSVANWVEIQLLSSDMSWRMDWLDVLGGFCD